MTENAAIPSIQLLPGRDKRVRGGHPWIYSNELNLTSPHKQMQNGQALRVVTASGDDIGIGLFNPHHLIALRMISRAKPNANDAGFWAQFWDGFFRAKITAALNLRKRLFPLNFYRLCHAEADGLPGIIMDRYDNVLVGQINIAWPAPAITALIAAAQEILNPVAMIWRDPEGHHLPLIGDENALTHVTLHENGARFQLDLRAGQKTGWFYDHSANRKFMADLSAGRRLLDLFCYQGGFGIAGLVAGASSAQLVDGSAAALALAEKAAVLNEVGDKCQTCRGDVFDVLEEYHKDKQKFDSVVADPPAFVKSRKDLAVGLKAYGKIFALAAGCVAKDGLLFAASCSHNVSEIDFLNCVRHGLTRAGRSGRIIRAAGANFDHPIHPHLDESAYLKSLLIQLD